VFHIVTLLLFSSIMFSALYQFWFNKNDMMMVITFEVTVLLLLQLQIFVQLKDHSSHP